MEIGDLQTLHSLAVASPTRDTMSVTLLDTVTGERCHVICEYRGFDWAENNNSCDCNRAGYFGPPEGYEERMIPGLCDGCYRFLIIDYIDNLNPGSYTLKELNSGYPAELLRQHGIERGVIS